MKRINRELLYRHDKLYPYIIIPLELNIKIYGIIIRKKGKRVESKCRFKSTNRVLETSVLSILG